MKTRMILAAMLLLAFGTLKAQDKLIPTPDGDGSKINTLVINGTGSIDVQLGDKLMINDNRRRSVRYHVEDSVLYVNSGWPVTVTMQNLTYLRTSGTGSVNSKGILRGDNLSVTKTGTGKVSLEVDYDNVYVRATGIDNVVLSGDCNVFCGEEKGIGKVNTNNLKYKVLVAKSGDRWNMAINMDDDLDGLRKNYLNEMVKKAQPFFETESNRSWDLKDNGIVVVETFDTLQLKELMRELGVNLQRLSDTVDWEKFERDMEEWGEEMEEWGRKMEKWGERFERKHGKDNVYHYEYKNTPSGEHKNTPSGCGTADQANKSSKRSLLLNPHWQGFDAGLNMLIDPTAMDIYTGDNGYMETRPLRSWYFGFNIADVGIAFDRNKRVGMFTGVGLGWNNYSWKNFIQMTVDGGELVNTLIPDDRVVKNSKMGVLYLQVPLMVEVRPTKRMYIDLGVTGGVRLAAWTRIKYADGQNVKSYSGYLTNLMKCDASLRVGGENIGFFVNYALVPLFTKGRDANKAHPLSLGFSIVF